MSLEPIDQRIRKYGNEYAIEADSGSLFERAWALRGFTQLLIDFYTIPSFGEKLLDKITEYDVELTKSIVERPIDIFHFGDDYSDQKGMMMSPAMWREFIKPRLKRILSIPRKKGIPVFFHCDGNPTDILGDFVEVGDNDT